MRAKLEWFLDSRSLATLVFFRCSSYSGLIDVLVHFSITLLYRGEGLGKLCYSIDINLIFICIANMACVVSDLGRKSFMYALEAGVSYLAVFSLREE